MFLSIIIPVYNAGNFLTQCLDSCIAQNLKSDDYEIICINDGSTDNSLNILHEYSNKYNNIIVVNQSNHGVSYTRNKGIEYSKGDYIWFVDSDDIIKTNCLQQLKDFTIDDQDIVDFWGLAFKNNISNDDIQLLTSNQLKGNIRYWGYPWIHIYKTATIKNNNIKFIENIKYGEDEMFYINVYEHSEIFSTLDETMYLYRQHSGSAVSKLKYYNCKLERVKSIILSIQILKTGLESDTYKKDFTASFLYDRYKLCSQCLAELKSKDAKTCFEQMLKCNLFTYNKKIRNIPNAKEFKANYRKLSFIKRPVLFIRNLIPSPILRFVKSIVLKSVI